MTNMLKKVFNCSELHLSEMTCYKIYISSSKPKSKSARVTYYEEGLDSESLEEGNFLFVIYKIGAVL